MHSDVSVVIPCYNQARLLPEAIESARRQTSPPSEIIVVDDGATDDTAAVAVSYSGVRCVRQPNEGLAGARNTGLRASQGEYVVFLDADDRLLPEACAVGAASLAAHPLAAFAVGRHRCITLDGRAVPCRARPRVERDHYVSLLQRCWITMPATVMYRRRRLEYLGGFDASLRCVEDYDLYLRATRYLPIVDHYTEIAEYRQHPGTLSGNAERMLAATLTVLARHRPGRTASPAHRAAYRARESAVWYFDRLLDRALDDARHGRAGPALRRFVTFARYLPRHPAYARRRMGTPFRLARRLLRATPG